MLAQLLQYVHDAGYAVITACAPVLAYAFLARLGLEKNALAQTIATTAINRAAGVALDYGMSIGDPLLLSAINKNAALQAGVNYATQAAGASLSKLKVDDAALGQKVSSQVAILLHVPTVRTLTLPQIIPAEKTVAPSIIKPVVPPLVKPLAPGQKFPDAAIPRMGMKIPMPPVVKPPATK